jgi:TRAP-type mannitol/chloroaromatic compound transport system permease small subunit
MNGTKTQSLSKIAAYLAGINELLGRALAWLTLLMVLITFAVVVLRYGFNLGWIGMQESVSYLHALVFMLGAGYAFKHEAHVRVDIFYRNFSPRRQAWINLLGNLLLLIPFTVFILVNSFDYVAASWRIHEASSETGGLPYIYLLKTVIPAMAVVLLLQAVANSLENLVTLISGQSASHDSEVEV